MRTFFPPSWTPDQWRDDSEEAPKQLSFSLSHIRFFSVEDCQRIWCISFRHQTEAIVTELNEGMQVN